jgi:ABC-type Fe3+/spermidine/putrescine transport system ATPase subunit
MLTIEELIVKAGVFQLGPVSLQIKSGERHALLGPSGSGKSTLLESVIGFRRTRKGRLLIDGRNMINEPVESRGIGYVPQQLALFPHLTVRDNIYFGMRMRRLREIRHSELAEILIEEAGLSSLTSRYPETLSGGERQRVALVRALASGPRLLILDEPFSALNETLRRELWSLVKKLSVETKVTTLMVTHDFEEAFVLGEQISVLIGGKLHQSDVKEIVYRRPATAEVARFLGINNLFPADVIGRDGNFILLDCPSLKTHLVVTPGMEGKEAPAEGTAVMVGIWPERVALRRRGQPQMPSEVRLEGEVVRLVDNGRGISLSFRPNGCSVLLEVIAGPREMENLKLTEMQTGLAASHLFYVPVETI